MNLTSTLNNVRQLPAEQLVAKASQVLPPWVTLLLVIAVASKLATLTWLLVPGGKNDPIAAAAAAPVQAERDREAQSVNLQAIVDAHLFGTATTQQQPVINPTDITETRLPLELSGIIAHDDPPAARAIISENNVAQVYAVGEVVSGGARVHAILRDRVILNRSGHLERLELPEEFRQTAAPRRASRSNTLSRAGRRNLREMIAQNPAQLTDIIRPTPYHDQGKLRGYRVYPGRERQKFTRLGLRPGDIVTAINGTALDDPARGLQVFQDLGSANQATVTLERNGQQQTVVISADQLDSPRRAER